MPCIQWGNIVEEREICITFTILYCLGFPVELGNKWFVFSNSDYRCLYYFILVVEYGTECFSICGKGKTELEKGVGGKRCSVMI